MTTPASACGKPTTPSAPSPPHDPSVTLFSLFYVILDPATGRFSYDYARHNALFLKRPDGSIGTLPMTGRAGPWSASCPIFHMARRA